MRTSGAKYQCSKPAAPYRKLHAALEQQAALAAEVHAALTPASGGDPNATMDQVSSAVRCHCIAFSCNVGCGDGDIAVVPSKNVEAASIGAATVLICIHSYFSTYCSQVAARLMRAKVAKGYLNPREALLLNGR